MRRFSHSPVRRLHRLALAVTLWAVAALALLTASLAASATGNASAASAGGPAASTLPARQAAVAAALDWLRSPQGPDWSPQNPNRAVGMACDLALLVAGAGENPGAMAWAKGGISLLDVCTADVPVYLARRDSGRMAKVLRAVVAAGANPRQFGGLDLIAELEAKYDPATGLYDPNFFYRHGLAVLALLEARQPQPVGVLPALLAQQHPDGSWSWGVDANPGDGFAAAGDLDSTGLTLQVLCASGLSLNHPAYTAGLNYLRGLQHDDGGWGLEDGPTNANSTALAILGILSAGWDPEAQAFQRNGTDPTAVLLGFQEASGAFVFRYGAEESRSMATYDSVNTLLQYGVARPYRHYWPHIFLAR